MRRYLGLIAVLAVLAAVAYGANHYLGGRQQVHTDNAYTTGDIIGVAAQLDDVILWMGAEEGDYVEQGQELVVLDGGTPKTCWRRRRASWRAPCGKSPPCSGGRSARPPNTPRPTPTTDWRATKPNAASSWPGAT